MRIIAVEASSAAEFRSMGSNGLCYTSLGHGTCCVSGLYAPNHRVETGRLVIPSVSPAGETVISIGARAFDGQRGLTSVVLPASVQRIETRAFSFCTDLVHLTVEANSRLWFIGSRAFIGCDALTEWALPHSVSVCGEKAFAHCTHLRTLLMSDAMTELAPGLLEGCRRLETVSLPRRLMRIGSAAFSACVSLPSLWLPPTVRCIGARAFASCSTLTHIAIPKDCTSMAPTAFVECPSLSLGRLAG